VVECKTYLEVLERLEKVATSMGARDLEDLLSFTFGDLVRTYDVSPKLFRFLLAVAELISEALMCRERVGS
jgi:hypothetical protein